jgi:hypothetical protein
VRRDKVKLPERQKAKGYVESRFPFELVAEKY